MKNAMLSANAFIKAVCNLEWNTSFEQFCQILNLAPDLYAMEKWEHFKAAIREINALGDFWQDLLNSYYARNHEVAIPREWAQQFQTDGENVNVTMKLSQPGREPVTITLQGPIDSAMPLAAPLSKLPQYLTLLEVCKDFTTGNLRLDIEAALEQESPVYLEIST